MSSGYKVPFACWRSEGVAVGPEQIQVSTAACAA